MPTEQKIVVITGASRGIGASLVKGFRGIGYGVVANARTIEKSDDPAILAVEGDIAEPETAERIVGAAIARFGRIDTLINNAGAFIAKPFIDYSGADFVTIAAVNLAGFFHITQKVASSMLQAGSGHIVTITATISRRQCIRRRRTHSSPACSPWAGWARCMKSPRPFSIWKRRTSSPAKSCMLTVAGP
jgi:NAD(P)-dependent dehydrogenase (short-subunit alcohol dehydrogenase family)